MHGHLTYDPWKVLRNISLFHFHFRFCLQQFAVFTMLWWIPVIFLWEPSRKFSTWREVHFEPNFRLCASLEALKLMQTHRRFHAATHKSQREKKTHGASIHDLEDEAYHVQKRKPLLNLSHSSTQNEFEVEKGYVRVTFKNSVRTRIIISS